MSLTIFFVIVHYLVVVLTIFRVIIRPHREPAARIAWIAVIATLPILGIFAYFFFGEVDIGRKHVAKMRKVLAEMPVLALPASDVSKPYGSATSDPYKHLFELGKSISGFDPVGGNSAVLMENSEAMIESLVSDIDGAKEHVHILFYIWLPDRSGCKIIEALKQAAARGVACRAMADNLGSRTLIKSKYWRDMKEAGVKLAVVLPMFGVLAGRIDLRNHRKITVIDGNITYCGSQNCADAEFLPKAKYAPWVDAVMRFEGPVARQNQHLFVSDWMTATNEDITDLLRGPILLPLPSVRSGGFTAQVIGTGPTDRHWAMSQMFVALIETARKDLIITTPYYVPNEPIQSALQSASYRGVKTTIIFPRENDSRIVQGASRSYYHGLLNAGVQIFEFGAGLLHAKTLTIDGEFAMIGSANMDRRSFDLNYENNMLIHDEHLVAEIIQRQHMYMEKSEQVSEDTVRSWSFGARLWNNAVAMLGPIL